MKIGLIGEAPNDTNSMKYLLEKKYPQPDFDFVSMLDRIPGSNLDSQKTKRLLRIEYESKSPDIIIFIRDLDSLKSDKKQLSKRKQYFTDSNSVVNKKGLYLLHIYEIEALILADIETFNELYKCNILPIDDPMLIEEPKEYLRERAKQYNESDNPDIFKLIDFEKALGCRYFDEFINKLETKITH